MQTQMINQNVENSKKADKAYADYNKIQINIINYGHK